MPKPEWWDNPKTFEWWAMFLFILISGLISWLGGIILSISLIAIYFWIKDRKFPRWFIKQKIIWLILLFPFLYGLLISLWAAI